MGRKLLVFAIALLIGFGASAASAADTALQVDFLLSGSLTTDGSLNSGGKVYTCDAGTTCTSASQSDPRTTWQDSGKVTPHVNPIILDSLGQKVVYADGDYKMAVYDSDDNLVATLDNLEYQVEPTTGLKTVTTLTSSSTVIAITDDTLLCDATSGTVTVDMTAVSAVGNTGKELLFKKTDATANPCVIDPLGAQAIDGISNKTLWTQYDTATIESDGSNWILYKDIEAKAADTALLAADSGLLDSLDTAIVNSSTPGTSVVPITNTSTGRLDTSMMPAEYAIQVSNFVNSAFFNTVVTIPYDDTIPQIDEGIVLVKGSITTTSDGNVVDLYAYVNVSCRVESTTMIFGVFKDGEADALVALSSYCPSTGTDRTNVAIPVYRDTVATAGQVVYSIRGGIRVGNAQAYFNGDNTPGAGSPFLGGSMQILLRAVEVRQ